MEKYNRNPEVVKKLIIEHTQMNMSIRKKMKVMINKLPVPEPIEKVILDYVGMSKFKSF
jgi:translation initiation factor 2 beta subunit (eIF-2beta)/eIF-5